MFWVYFVHRSAWALSQVWQPAMPLVILRSHHTKRRFYVNKNKTHFGANQTLSIIVINIYRTFHLFNFIIYKLLDLLVSWFKRNYFPNKEVLHNLVSINIYFTTNCQGLLILLKERYKIAILNFNLHNVIVWKCHRLGRLSTDNSPEMLEP